ncbi:hypothetical protein [Pontibaca salina]|uniref:Uncharacterized protein n=1 Tax=Pontibaca salina TaxID=2795731 RepID=A0A934HRJ1_9RHOB|nr:hypothetical protein [Pontibaca salina]MBI6628314.1 hypothetical protein [Pontibaca salina]
MNHGFYHPERGYWQTITTPTPEQIAALPEGTVTVPLKPGADYDWDGTQWVHTPPDPVEALEQERAGMVASRFQAKAALSAAGLLDATEQAIAAADDFTKLAWGEAVEFRRNSPTIAALAAALELTPEQVDDLFRAAMQIEA